MKAIIKKTGEEINIICAYVTKDGKPEFIGNQPNHLSHSNYQLPKKSDISNLSEIHLCQYFSTKIQIELNDFFIDFAKRIITEQCVSGRIDPSNVAQRSICAVKDRVPEYANLPILIREMCASVLIGIEAIVENESKECIVIGIKTGRSPNLCPNVWFTKDEFIELAPYIDDREYMKLVISKIKQDK